MNGHATPTLKQPTDAGAAAGLALVNALDTDQLAVAVVSLDRSQPDELARAFDGDERSGLRGDAMTGRQRELMLDLCGLYIGDGGASVTAEEVAAHLDDTYFTWVGANVPGAVFYYRVQSPVLLIQYYGMDLLRIARRD